MEIKDIKTSMGRRCRVSEPETKSYTMPLTGEYIVTGYGYEVEYYDNVPRRTVRVQLEGTELRPVRVWLPPERIILMEDQNERENDRKNMQTAERA